MINTQYKMDAKRLVVFEIVEKLKGHIEVDNLRVGVS